MSASISIQKLPELHASHVRMKNPADVERKLIRLVEGGKDHLQIITDFDRTLSRQHYNGELTKSSYCVFESIQGLPKNFVEGTQALYKKFRCIEDDPSLTKEEKMPHMEEWYTKSEKLYVGLKYDQAQIEQAVVDCKVMLREGTEKCLLRLKEASIPVLVFSAGLGDVVRVILQHNKVSFDNQHIISNFFTHKDGVITGFQGDVIHIYNKNQHAVENCDYFEELSHRENVILMGDSLGDANMAEGVRGNGAVLKIGFLSVNIEQYLPQYLELFDIVLLDDSTMNVFSALLDLILNDT